MKLLKKLIKLAILIAICILVVRWLYSKELLPAELPTTTTTTVTAAASETETESLPQLGTLAPESEQLHFKNRERLEEHFEKHNEDFGYASPEEYEAGANAVVHNPKALSKLEKEDGDYVYFLEETGEFVIVSPKKVIRTYYLADRDYFDRQ